MMWELPMVVVFFWRKHAVFLGAICRRGKKPVSLMAISGFVSTKQLACHLLKLLPLPPMPHLPICCSDDALNKGFLTQAEVLVKKAAFQETLTSRICQKESCINNDSHPRESHICARLNNLWQLESTAWKWQQDSCLFAWRIKMTFRLDVPFPHRNRTTTPSCFFFLMFFNVLGETKNSNGD